MSPEFDVRLVVEAHRERVAAAAAQHLASTLAAQAAPRTGVLTYLRHRLWRPSLPRTAKAAMKASA